MRRTQYLKPLIVIHDLLVDILKLTFFSCFDRLALWGRAAAADAGAAILVVRVDAIGDYLFFRPFLARLKQCEEYKNHHLVLCANPVWREVAENFDSAMVDRFIWLDRKKFSRSLPYRWKKLRQLTDTSYRAAINPTFSRNLFFDDRIVKIVTAAEKIAGSGDPGTVGGWRKFIADKAYSKLLPISPKVHFDLFRNQEFCRLLLGAEIDLPSPLIPPADPPPVRLELPDRYAVLFISASAGYRKWPLPYFLEIGTRIRELYNLDIVLCGGPEDANEVRKTAWEFRERLLNLVGKTSLLELYSVINEADLLISNETMAPHFACLPDRTPCIVVYNGNNFGRALPYPPEISRQHYSVCHPDIAANPEGYQRISNRFGFYNTLDISIINPADVIAKVQEVMVAEKLAGPGRSERIPRVGKAADPVKQGGLRAQGIVSAKPPDKVLLSIITVVFNGEKFLEQTIKSVLNQDYDNVEYIIIDGGSTDQSLDIIGRHESSIAYWQSGPDQGLYDAMNKGIALATGSLIGIINADDWYEPGIFSRVIREHRSDPNAIVHGGMNISEQERTILQIPAPRKLTRLAKGMIINHPTVFIPGHLYRQYGAFDTAFSIAADWDLMIRFRQRQIPFRPVPEIIANFRLGGASFNYNRQQIEEKHAVRVKNRLGGGWDWHYVSDRIKLIFPEQWITRASLIKQQLLNPIRWR